MLNITTYYGELAAISTVMCWTVGSQCFEAAGKRIGSLTVNIIRLVVALLLFCITLYFTTGSFFPVGFPIEAWLWLGLSGLIGFSIGDLFLFKAFVEIGPRLSMLILSLSAPMTAVIGWLFLDEQYLYYQWIGIMITLIGVAWVIFEKGDNNKNQKKIFRAITLKGVLLAFGGMLGQAIGYIFSKVGMSGSEQMLEPFASTQIRVLAGLLGFIGIFTIMGYWRRILPAMRNRSAMLFLTAGSFLGPFLGVSLSLKALHYTSAGIASTIMALTPVFIIPFSILIHNEHVSYRGILGALVAFSGVALLIVKF